MDMNICEYDDDDNVNEKSLYSMMYILMIGQHLSSYSHTNITQKSVHLFLIHVKHDFVYSS
jgi:hypothetical protein